MNNEIKIPVTKLKHFQGLDLPMYQTKLAAGLDLQAAIEFDMTIEAGRGVSIPTGLAIAIPAGYEAQVRPRSGLAMRHSIGVLNSPGTIDADYRGEICILLFNFGRESFQISRGDRIAQLVFAKVERAAWKLVEDLPKSERGSGGFGSTGL